jgi:hypothetical protein
VHGRKAATADLQIFWPSEEGPIPAAKLAPRGRHSRQCDHSRFAQFGAETQTLLTREPVANVLEMF